MAEKCDICGEKIRTTFLDKIDGTYVYKDGKRKAVCAACQKKPGEKAKDIV